VNLRFWLHATEILTLSFRSLHMTSLYQAVLSQAVMGQLPSMRVVSQFSAAEIRQTLADLVAAERVDLANALADAGQSLYPDSEDILAISALLAEIQQNWTLAEDILRKLVDIQGAATTPFTWRHLIRVLRCQCEPGKALQAAKQALDAYPDDDALNDEFLALQALVSQQLPVEASNQMH
jgi:tetratricopeptide (TPR) repeat protein